MHLFLYKIYLAIESINTFYSILKLMSMFYLDLHSIEQTLMTVYTSTKKRKLPRPLLANTEQ